MNLIITCLSVFILQIITSTIRYNEIKHCYDDNTNKMLMNAFWGSLVSLLSITLSISPLVKIINGDTKFIFVDILAPLCYIAGSVIGKYFSSKKD
jgi:hypothetical protein